MKLGIWYVAMLFRGIVLVRGRLLVAGYEEVGNWRLRNLLLPICLAQDVELRGYLGFVF